MKFFLTVEESLYILKDYLSSVFYINQYVYLFKFNHLNRLNHFPGDGFSISGWQWGEKTQVAAFESSHFTLSDISGASDMRILGPVARTTE